jgi:hypothetical protein
MQPWLSKGRDDPARSGKLPIDRPAARRLVSLTVRWSSGTRANEHLATAVQGTHHGAPHRRMVNICTRSLVIADDRLPA